MAAGLGAVLPAARAAGGALWMQGRGVQIYRCDPAGSPPGWRLLGPDAVLTDAAGTRLGTHGIGPSWRAVDGSAILAAPVASSPAPAGNAVPWLLLRVTSRTGSGAFADTAYVARLQTSGGVAPAGGCDAGHAGAQMRVPYAAIYVLFREAPPAVLP